LIVGVEFAFALIVSTAFLLAVAAGNEHERHRPRRRMLRREAGRCTDASAVAPQYEPKASE